MSLRASKNNKVVFLVLLFLAYKAEAQTDAIGKTTANKRYGDESDFEAVGVII